MGHVSGDLETASDVQGLATERGTHTNGCDKSRADQISAQQTGRVLAPEAERDGSRSKLGCSQAPHSGASDRLCHMNKCSPHWASVTPAMQGDRLLLLCRDLLIKLQSDSNMFVGLRSS